MFDIRGVPRMVVSQNASFTMDNPTMMDDFGGTSILQNLRIVLPMRTSVQLSFPTMQGFDGFLYLKTCFRNGARAVQGEE